jgi:hypothetical protein
VFEVLMPDLVGHDRRPAAFVVYLYLLHSAHALGRDRVPASLQTIAVDTGGYPSPPCRSRCVTSSAAAWSAPKIRGRRSVLSVPSCGHGAASNSCPVI